MTTHLRPHTIALALSLGLFGHAQSTLAASKDPSKVASKSTSNFRVVPEVAIPQSSFLIPTQPSEGRNPFFPQSVARVIPQKLNRETPIDTASFVLNGITSPPRRTAMINGRTFEPGEEGEVRLPNGGKMLIKCQEIKAESAIILINGLPRELRLRSGL